MIVWGEHMDNKQRKTMMVNNLHYLAIYREITCNLNSILFDVIPVVNTPTVLNERSNNTINRYRQRSF